MIQTHDLESDDLESERDQEFTDRVEHHLQNFMRNLNVGDMRDLLERQMDNEQYLITMLQILVLTKDPLAFFIHNERMLKEMMTELAEQQAEKERRNREEARLMR